MRSNRGLFNIISVQSRKGGVGKTTFSLNLAQYCLTQNHPVLFLDFDMTGTAASEFERVETWKEHVHVVKNSDKKTPCDLVTLFEDYMADGVSFFMPDTHTFEQNNVNIISSFIEPLSSPQALGPTVLFDELHASWFIDMTRELIYKWLKWHEDLEAFQHPSDDDADHATVSALPTVIIDNAPGYSGLEPELENWLMDLGPKVAKFIFLASPEPQDLHACEKGVRALFTCFDRRVKVSKAYSDKDEKKVELVKLLNGDDKDEVDYCKKFFHRLVETEPRYPEKCCFPAPPRFTHNGCKRSGLCYYRHDPKSDDGNGFIGLLVNKVDEVIYLNTSPLDGRNNVKVFLGKTLPNFDWQRIYWEWIPFDIRFISMNYLHLIEGSVKSHVDMEPALHKLIQETRSLRYESVAEGRAPEEVIISNMEAVLSASKNIDSLLEVTEIKDNIFLMAEFWMDQFYPLDALNPIAQILGDYVDLKIPRDHLSVRSPENRLSLASNLLLFTHQDIENLVKEILEDIRAGGRKVEKNQRGQEEITVAEIITIFSVPILAGISVLASRMAQIEKIKEGLLVFAKILVKILVEIEYCFINRKISWTEFQKKRRNPAYWRRHLSGTTIVFNECINSIISKSWSCMIEAFDPATDKVARTLINLDKQSEKIKKIFELCCMFHARVGLDNEIGANASYLMEILEKTKRFGITNTGRMLELRQIFQNVQSGNAEAAEDKEKLFVKTDLELKSIFKGSVEMRVFQQKVQSIYEKMGVRKNLEEFLDV